MCLFFLTCVILFLFHFRIRALYAQILEKDAVIKILNQRLHQDQSRKAEQSPRTNLVNTVGAALRPASSTPSISTACTKVKGQNHYQPFPNYWMLESPLLTFSVTGSLGKNLSDDQSLPVRQFSAQSEPSTLEKQPEETKPTEETSTTKLINGEQTIRIAACSSNIPHYKAKNRKCTRPVIFVLPYIDLPWWGLTSWSHCISAGHGL